MKRKRTLSDAVAAMGFCTYTEQESPQFNRGPPMRVGDFMTRDPITVEEDASMKEAMLLLRSHHIRHLPVATGKLLVGLVSDRDIKRASPSILQGIDKREFEQLMEDTP